MEYFEQIYRSMFRDVYLYLLKLTHDENLAEELTAETFFRALHHLDSFRGDSNIKSYLIQIGKNAFFDYLREQKKFSNEEIGKFYQRTANWACFRYHRAKKKLKEILDRNAAQEWDEEESNE